MRTTPYIAKEHPVPRLALSALCLAWVGLVSAVPADVGDAIAGSASRRSPEIPNAFEGIDISSEPGRVSLRLDAVALETFCRYLGGVHGINALVSKGVVGNLNGSADGKDLERVGEILLRRNGFDPVWIGGVLVVRAGSRSGSESLPFAMSQGASLPQMETSAPSEAYQPPYLPMGPAIAEPATENPPTASNPSEGTSGPVSPIDSSGVVPTPTADGPSIAAGGGIPPTETAQQEPVPATPVENGAGSTTATPVE